MPVVRIGTRASPLAMWQANHVAGLLRGVAPESNIELVPIQTVGDQIRDVPLREIGGDGVFTKAIQDAVLEGRADIAVHSLKDLPTFAVEGLVLAATPPRGPAGDAFVSLVFRAFVDLPDGAIIATSSVRRRAQLLHRRPDLRLIDIRGNVETRLGKLRESKDLAGIILAEAGLERLGLRAHVTEILDASWMLPAVGQGALGLECRADDKASRDLLEKINHPPTRWQVLAERAFLRGMGGGCQVPIGAVATVSGVSLTLRGAVLGTDGGWRVENTMSGRSEDAERIGASLAADLIAQTKS